MPTLLLRLAGPMQSWGTTSRFNERDSQLEPSKSGIIGMICAALGRDRAEHVEDLAILKMGVRVDREGVLMRDYQTATGVVTAEGKKDLSRTVLGHRYYLSDAVFLVGLEGEDRFLLESINSALRRPVWPLALGRKGFPPGIPVWLKDGLLESSLREALISYPLISRANQSNADHPLRLVLEHPREGSVRRDQPIAPFIERRFGPRHISTETINGPFQTQDSYTFKSGGKNVPE